MTPSTTTLYHISHLFYYHQKSHYLHFSPRPKTAGPGTESSKDYPEIAAGSRVDKARPLSASTAAPSAKKLRASFKRNKARNELVRALSRGNSFARPGSAKPQVTPRENRGGGGKAIEMKYASHNAKRVDTLQQHQQQPLEEEEVEMIDEVAEKQSTNSYSRRRCSISSPT